MHRVALTLSLALVGVAASAARADQPDVAAIEAAAEASFQAGDYRAALRGFERLYRLRPQAETLFAIARCHQELGECDRAAEVFQDFLASRPDPAARKAAEARMASCTPASVDAPSTPVPGPSPGPTGVVLEPPPAAAPEAPPRSRRGLVLGVALGSVAVGGGAVVLELLGRSALSDARTAAAAGDRTGLDAAYDRAQRYHYAAQLGGALAIGGAIGAGVLWWTRPRARTAPQLAIVPARSGSLVTWTGAF